MVPGKGRTEKCSIFVAIKCVDIFSGTIYIEKQREAVFCGVKKKSDTPLSLI